MFFKEHPALRLLFKFISNWRLFKMLLPTEKKPFQQNWPIFLHMKHSVRQPDLYKPKLFYSALLFIYVCESVSMLKPYFFTYLKRKQCVCMCLNILYIIPPVLYYKPHVTVVLFAFPQEYNHTPYYFYGNSYSQSVYWVIYIGNIIVPVLVCIISFWSSI